MTSEPAEVHRLTGSLTIWQRYDPKVKADLFSTAVKTGSGVYVVDPILPAAALENILGIVVTNANHFRAAESLANKLSVPIFAHPKAEIAAAGSVADGDRIAPGLAVIEVNGAAPGEIALHHEAEGGSLIVGDALINFGSHGFTLLPAKYCSDPKLMRKSLRRLLDFSFTRILFAHGTPITTNAHDRLLSVLEESG